MKYYKCKPSNGYYSFGTHIVHCDYPLERQPYAQAGVDYFRTVSKKGLSRFGYRLVSYVTAVCFLDNNNVLHVSDTYSRTTSKHISSFLREYVPKVSYQMVKLACAKGKAIDCDTLKLIDDDLVYDDWSNVNYFKE